MVTINRSARDDNPIVRYAERELWSNPEHDKQYQVKVWRISPPIGAISQLGYMGKWRLMPRSKKRYHVFTAGGTNPGIWNLTTGKRLSDPIDRWISATDVGTRRGVQIDIYTGSGLQFPRTKAWFMFTFDGLTLLALEHLVTFPLDLEDNIHFRCYSTDLDITKSTEAFNGQGNGYVYQSMDYESPQEYAAFNTWYAGIKAKPGHTDVFLNGMRKGNMPNSNELRVGDIVEVWHDPTVRRVIRYKFNVLQDFYSTLDKSRKYILHPPKDGDFSFRYYDDNDYYLVAPNGDGVYYNRNNVDSVRQLTHIDVSLSVTQVKNQANSFPDLLPLETLEIMVLERDTLWEWVWPWESQHIRHLYRLSDENIIRAMTGARSVMPEWTADELENGPVQSMIRSFATDLTTDSANKALGYNAKTKVVSDTPVRVYAGDYVKGVPIPDSYIQKGTAWEYNESGQLLGYYPYNAKVSYIPISSDCKKIEFNLGHPARNIHYDIVRDDFKLPDNVGITVYSSAFSIVQNKPVGKLTDVSATDFYHIENGFIVFDKMDKVNQCAIICYDDVFLCRSFTLNHLDHSLCFSIDDIYESVLGNLDLAFAQIDVWVNGYPLIDTVDWVFKDRLIYINSRQYLKEGGQDIVVRCYGYWKDVSKPKFELELGFVAGGVIGDMPRYNIREDRDTRIVVGGKLMLLDELKTAEQNLPDNYDYPLNGMPYMVKHTYTPVLFAEPFNHYLGYAESRVTDKRVVDYLTKWCPKPKITVDYNMQDKHQLYSSFMNVVVNAILNGVLVVPSLDGNEVFPDQTVEDLVSVYKWWLATDAVTLGFDLRYFIILPYANIDTVTVNNDEFTFLRQVNQRYLNSVLSITGYFEVSNNVR